MHELAQILTMLALLGAGALVGASLYDAVVIAPNLRAGPAGLEHWRLFMAAATPAHLFRKLAPATLVLMALSAAANWANAPARWMLVGSVVALVLVDLITFKYHYPRNRLMLTAPLDVPAESLALVARQWANANLVRVALILVAWLGAAGALLRTAA